MAEGTGVTTASPPPPRVSGVSGRTASFALLAPVALVVVFWWAATGLTIVLQRDGAARTIGLAATALLAVAGAVLVVRSRADRSARGARAAFLGGALLWWWTAALFYAGWGVAPASVAAGPPRSLALAAQAIAATWRADAVALVVLAAVAAAVWRRPNRVALGSLLAFWGTLQTAKLNVFVGVRNPGGELLPPQLAGLQLFFAPPVNSWLLPLTVVALAALSGRLITRAVRTSDAFVRQSSAIVGVLLALAVLEHVLLGVRAGPALWAVFLEVRG